MSAGEISVIDTFVVTGERVFGATGIGCFGVVGDFDWPGVYLGSCGVSFFLHELIE